MDADVNDDDDGYYEYSNIDKIFFQKIIAPNYISSKTAFDILPKFNVNTVMVVFRLENKSEKLSDSIVHSFLHELMCIQFFK